MTPEEREKRQRVMGRSLALGHCVCDPQKPCPCPMFKERDVCECAGESLPPPPSGEIRLTRHVRAAGCASKISKKVLHEVLAGLPEIPDPRVIIGRSAGDDAGVIMIDEKIATILTVDVFSPSVDDPYTFGQIAAANSLSDIYAMGGVPQSALSIIGFPVHTLPPEVMREILRGGIDKMAEAGIGVIGGHSINDEEIKCGFAVIGTAAPQEVKANHGARIGDMLVLTKPLGTGITAFAAQIGRAGAQEVAEISRSMCELNRTAAELMRVHHARAATDVTGFSLLGHLAEIVRRSKVCVELDFSKIPLFSGVERLAGQDAFPGAVERNRESVPAKMLDFGQLPQKAQNVLFGPETSGGLLVCLSPADAEGFIAQMRAQGKTAAIIGKVCAPCEDGLIRVRASGDLAAYADKPAKTAQNITAAQPAVTHTAPAADSACCAGATAPAVPQSAAADDTPSCCAQGQATRVDTLLPPPAAAAEFKGYMAAASAPRTLGQKVTKLIALALSVSHKCGPCVKINVDACRKAGATSEEIAQAIAQGIAFGGATAAMFYNELAERG